MSLLIADAGASKTSWVVVSGSDQISLTTEGLNPALKVNAEIESVIFDDLVPRLSGEVIDEVHFYGAGCAYPPQAQRLETILSEAFRNAAVHVRTDIEGAGLAAFGEGEGIICISGTGSSAGFMSSGQLVDIMPAKPYPEGDYGSGSHIGALLLTDYFEEKSPESMSGLINSNRKMSDEELFLQFQDPARSKRIAAKVMTDVVGMGEFSAGLDEGYIFQKVKESVALFYDQLEDHFGETLAAHQLKFTGSTAFHFQDVFRELFSGRGIEITEITKNPIKRLTEYHKKRL